MPYLSSALRALGRDNDLELREIERSAGFSEVLCPRDLTSVQVETWLDWADSLPHDLPAGAASLAIDPEADVLTAPSPPMRIAWRNGACASVTLPTPPWPPISRRRSR